MRSDKSGVLTIRTKVFKVSGNEDQARLIAERVARSYRRQHAQRPAANHFASRGADNTVPARMIDFVSPTPPPPRR